MTAASPTPATRGELVRALGAVITTPPPDNARLREALSLPPETAADHTAAFVLGLPPFAAIYLGGEGQLGGEAQDRVAGFWRALELSPPPDADHLGVLLLLHAELDAVAATADGPARARLVHTRDALLREHVLSWAPAYLDAVTGLDVGPATAWAELTSRLLRQLAEELPEVDELPAALRQPLKPVDVTSRGALLDSVLAPVRSGLILAQRDLAAAADQLGLGLRRGERRFALRALLDQDARGTLRWLAATATAWAERHRLAFPQPAVACWWTERAEQTATTLTAAARTTETN